jgi:hypothetical protein
MAPYIIEITQGETLFREIVVKDEGGTPVSLTGATPSVVVSGGIPDTDFTITKPGEVGYLELRAAGNETGLWPQGHSTLQVWLDWGPSADIENEIILEVTIAVRSAL